MKNSSFRTDSYADMNSDSDMEICPVCRAALDFDSKFCEVCGTAAFGSVECPKCSGNVSATARFCRHCSHDLSKSPRQFARPSVMVLASVGTILVVVLVALTYGIFSGQQRVTALEAQNTELQRQLEEKNSEIAQKGDLIAQKAGEISTLSGSLEEREKTVAEQEAEIKKLTGSLTVVSTCISGLARSSSAERYEDYGGALIALRQAQPSCKKAADVIKKFDKFR